MGNRCAIAITDLTDWLHHTTGPLEEGERVGNCPPDFGRYKAKPSFSKDLVLLYYLLHQIFRPSNGSDSLPGPGLTTAAHRLDRCQKPAKKSKFKNLWKSLFIFRYAINSLTDFKCEVHASSGNGNAVNIRKVVKIREMNLFPVFSAIWNHCATYPL